MSRAPRVAVIAIDGTDPETLARYLAAGRLPAIASALARSREAKLTTVADLFLTSVWPCALSGVAVENHGLHAFAPLRSGTLDTVEGADFEMPPPFWEAAVRAGIRTCVVDPPLYGPPGADAALDGLRFLEWGAHPPLRAPGSFPTDLAPAIVARHGLHPCTADDPTRSTVADAIAIRDGLCAGARLRGDVLADLLDDGQPDLLVAFFPETHTAGHQFLNLSDPAHAFYDAHVADALGGSPIDAVYAAVDVEVGRLLKRLSPDTTLLFPFLLGVRVTYGGSQLLGDLLIRMGLSTPARPLRTRAASLYRRVVPPRVRSVIRRRLPESFVTSETRTQFKASLDWTTTRAFALPWAYEGYLRINQRGREPQGIVEPGVERDALLTAIETELKTLRIAGSDDPAVVSMVRAQEEFPGRATGELPDLMVLWRNDRPIEAIESPTLGRIENRDRGSRSEHSATGSIYVSGDGVRPGASTAIARDVDVAPTVLALLGIAPPDGLDGRPIADLMRMVAAGS
jgi:predicted AlkP superfamily phosphohydrolase/phosphomutase